MKLNNKGFAITSILYALLILFVLLVGSYLTILTARKNRVDKIVSRIEDNYSFDTNETINIADINNFKAPYTGKYIINNNNNCTIYLSKGKTVDLNVLFPCGWGMQCCLNYPNQYSWVPITNNATVYH